MSRPRTSQARSPRRARFPRNASLRTEEVMRLPFANASGGNGGAGVNNCCDTITANMSGVVLGEATTSPSTSTTIPTPLQTTPIHGAQLANGNNNLMNTLLSSKDALQQHLQQQQQQQQHLHMQHNPPGSTNNNSHMMNHNIHHLHHHTAFPARPSPQDELMEGDPALPFV